MPIVIGIVAVLVVIGLFTNNDDEPANTPSATPTTGVDLDTPPDTTEAPAPVAPQVGTAIQAVVPDVVGMNHQLAQDTLQANGFYVLVEEDATGQGRQLVWDRNWEVVSQSVAGGTAAPIDTTITLRSKKIDE
ncbi:MAG: PASTA domain-containing protein [Actinophytocola sp.]|uniref:PASTA domain-containing protein n=1 Tax=Actinophytocola sp. TaxID=1872138 RepID=UPI003C75899E